MRRLASILSVLVCLCSITPVFAQSASTAPTIDPDKVVTDLEAAASNLEMARSDRSKAQDATRVASTTEERFEAARKALAARLKMIKVLEAARKALAVARVALMSLDKCDKKEKIEKAMKALSDQLRLAGGGVSRRPIAEYSAPSPPPLVVVAPSAPSPPPLVVVAPSAPSPPATPLAPASASPVAVPAVSSPPEACAAFDLACIQREETSLRTLETEALRAAQEAGRAATAAYNLRDVLLHGRTSSLPAPVYKRGWFWAAVAGGVVLVATAIVVPLALSERNVRVNIRTDALSP